MGAFNVWLERKDGRKAKNGAKKDGRKDQRMQLVRCPMPFINGGGGGTRCQRIRSSKDRILSSCGRFLNIDFINPMEGVGAPDAKGYDLLKIVSLPRVVVLKTSHLRSYETIY